MTTYRAVSPPFSHAISHAKAICSGFIALIAKYTFAAVMRLYGANMGLCWHYN